MLNFSDVLETVNMIENEHLDVRTITMGISLLDCVSDDENVLFKKVYDKITKYAENLVSVGSEIEKEYGIPIINKRISLTPAAIIGGSLDRDGYVRLAKTLDKAAKAVGVNFIGGFGALVQKGMSKGDIELIKTLPEALTTTDVVCSSVNVGSTRSGINMDAVLMLGKTIKDIAYNSRDDQSLGCAKFVVFSNVPEDNPFMAGAFHGVGENECCINVGVSGPGVVASAVKNAKGKDFSYLSDTIKKTAFKVTRMGQLVATEASKRLGVPFGIVDLSLAPTPAVGDSVAHILEAMGLERCGAHGTTAALARLHPMSEVFRAHSSPSPRTKV